ncbi:MAG: hypothetical protein AB7F99_03425 [Vicinamibacterales bacterium]
MPRALVPCLTIVAAFQLHIAAAAPLYEDVPVPAAVAEITSAIGLDPASDPAIYLSEFVRLLHGPMTGRHQSVADLMQVLAVPSLSATGDDLARVPVPLTAAFWSDAVFGRPVDASQLFHAIASDPNAALLAYGLAGLDDATLEFLAGQPGLLAGIYQRGAPVFAAFGESISIRDGRVATPGGDGAALLWSSVVGESPDRPAAFVRALLSQRQGRVAYLFDLIERVEPSEAAFAMGSWIADANLRTARFASLATTAANGYGEWNLQKNPFVRPLYDLSFLLMRARVDERGVLALPATRAFWSAAFSNDSRAPAPSISGQDDIVDAAWLAEVTGYERPSSRGDFLDQLAFAQRVFGGVEAKDLPDVLEAVRSFRSHRTLLLAIERMGITNPRVYADVVRRVAGLTDRDANRAFWQMAQLQGAVAIVARLTMVGTIERERAEGLLLSLVQVPLQQSGRYEGGVAEWIDRQLLPLLPSAPRSEARLVTGLAGPANPAAPAVVWEGQEYRLDFAAAEVDRLRAVRERQGSYSIDLALALHRIVRGLNASPSPAPAGAAASLSSAAIEFARELGRANPDIMAPGVRLPPDARTTMSSAASDLARAATSNDRGAVRRVSGQLTALVDTVLAEALISIAYAIDIGDPLGTALLGRNVAMRHDFGFTHAESGMRLRLPWMIPRQDFRPGVAWHVNGSLLGLDIALAPLSLRRLSSDLPPDAPSLSSIEREAFAVSVALVDRRRLNDGDRASIAAAIRRGRGRVAGLRADQDPAIQSVVTELEIDARRERVLRWTLAHAPDAVPSVFSLVEVLTLGGGAPGADLDAWGMGALAVTSCPCTRMMPAERWRLLEGRPQIGAMAAAVADLNLHLAVMLEDLQVPASLTKSILTTAVQELIERATPVHINDWRALFRAAQSVPRERVEDYVAAAAAVGGPLVPVNDDAAFQP